MQIIYFVLLLGLVILVHEIGHLVVAKLFNVYCGEFAIGMGPKLFSIKKKETTYSIRALPIGGFVTLAGDEFEDETIPKERTLPGIHPLKRIVIMLAGIAMNFLLGWLLLSSVIAMNGKIVVPPPPIIDKVMENTPAERAGLQNGDIIRQIEYSDGTIIKPDDFYDILNYNAMYTDERTITIERNGALFMLKITPEYNATENSYLIGITVPPGTIKDVSFLSSFQYGVKEAFDIAGDTVSAVGRILRGVGLKQLSGPIGIFNVTGEVMAQASSFVEGLKYFFTFAAILSINLMIMNLLPIPIMDGGRVLIIIVEMIIRKPVNKKLEQALMIGSMAILITLMIFVTYQDILNIFN